MSSNRVRLVDVVSTSLSQLIVDQSYQIFAQKSDLLKLLYLVFGKAGIPKLFGSTHAIKAGKPCAGLFIQSV